MHSSSLFEVIPRVDEELRMSVEVGQALTHRTAKKIMIYDTHEVSMLKQW